MTATGFMLGDIEIHLINDVSYLSDPGGPFGLVPRALWSKVLPPVDDYFVPMCQVCLLVRAGGRTILVDTGQGTKLSERQISFGHMRGHGGLMRGLAALNVRPEDVDLVINTHLHGDHCGGNTHWAQGSTEQVVPSFPNAEYVVQRREFEDAMQPNERTRATYQPWNYAPLLQNGQMRLLDGDMELLPGIHAIVTPGHTPGHMSVRFESGGHHAAFLCDMATFAVHFERLGWMTAFDVEPLITLETKRHWQAWAIETAATLIFVHETQRPVGYLTQTEKGPQLEALPIHYRNP